MEMSVHIQEETLIVRLSGELDLHSGERFRQAVREVFAERPDVRHLILALRDVAFIDSGGVGAILGRLRDVQARGGRMLVVEPQERVRKVLELSGVLQWVDSAASERRALQAL